MKDSNVLEFKKKTKEWTAPTMERPKPKVNLVSVDIATLLYNVIQAQRELAERLEEMGDMMEHMEYQIDQLRKEQSLRNRFEE